MPFRSPKILRDLVRLYVPKRFQDPFGLAGRILRTRDPRAYFALGSALLGVLTSPLDLVLSLIEESILAGASDPRRPVVIVCGPPRSGTSVAAQILIRNLPVAYFNNLASIFPRSPLTANLIFRGLLQNDRVERRSYYGKSLGFHGPHDALFLWERWLGGEAPAIPAPIPTANARRMNRFFGAYEAAFGRPVVCKNNALDTCASVVAEALPAARFICMRREPIFLAQSLLVARREIHGDLAVSYGADDPDRLGRGPTDDPVRDVAAQVAFHERRIEEEAARLGPEKFQVVSYEEFCRDPAALVRRVSEEILGEPFDAARGGLDLAPLEVHNRRNLSAEEFRHLEESLSLELGSAGLPMSRGEAG